MAQNALTSLFKEDITKGNETLQLKQGDTIIAEGDPSNNKMYFVLEGTLAVYKNLNNKLEQINTLSIGEFFGEIALIYDQPRSATVKVSSPSVKIMVVSKAKFVELTKTSPALMFSIFKALVVRLLRAETNFDIYIKKLGGINPEILIKINQYKVRKVSIQIIEYLKNIPRITVPMGKHVYAEDDTGNFTAYFIFKGKLDAYKNTGKKSVLVSTYEPGEFFGETAVITDRLRPNTMVVKSDTAILAPIDKVVFMKLIQLSPEFLFDHAKAIIFKLINTEKTTFKIKSELDHKKQETDIKNFKKGESIIKEGDPSNDTMYFILEGLVSVCKNRNDTLEEVNILKSGEFFGELSLISRQPRTASILVKSETASLILLSQDKFIQQTKANPALMVSILKATIARLFRAEVNLERMIKKVPDLGNEIMVKLNESRVDNLSIINYVHNLHQMFFIKNDTVFKEGEKSRGLIYFISQGELVETKTLNGKKVIISKLESGDFFGETSIITDIPRYVSVEVVSQKAKVMAIQREIFMKIIKMNPNFLFGLLRTVVWKLIITERTVTQLNIQYDMYQREQIS